MGIIKKLLLVSVAISLSACSMFEGKNTFMTYQDLQDQVQSHDTELQDMKTKLSKVDQLEAEVAQLKKAQGMDSSTASTAPTPATTDNSVAQRAAMASTDAAPAVTVAPMTASQMQTTQASQTAPQPVKMVTAAPVTQVAAPAPKAAPMKQQYKSQDNTYGVQLAAYGSREEAAHGWKVLSQASPDVYVNLVPHVNTKQVKGRTMYQLKVGPFLDRAYSVDFCNMLKQKGKDCLVSKYDGQPL